MSQLQDPKKLKLTDAKVVFYTGPEDEKAKEFGTSITVAVTPEQKKAIEEFYAANKVGKNGDPNKGKANIKEYTHPETGVTTEQWTCKFGDKTQWAGLNGLGQGDMGYGASVNLIAGAFDYSRFGGGVGVKANAVVVTKGAASNNDADLEELMDDLGEDTSSDDESVVPF